MDEPQLRLTREWLTKAAHDLQNARIVSTVPDGPLDTAIYHCQQAAEKSLKAWLVFRNQPVERTHDLTRLVILAAGGDQRFLDWEEAANVLTPYASAFRYPGLTADPLPSRAEFDEALRLAEGLHVFISGLLPKDSAP
jgi:HEPN domain-containing protein